MQKVSTYYTFVCKIMIIIFLIIIFLIKSFVCI